MQAECDLLVDVRGKGLMIGLELSSKVKAAEWMELCFQRSLLTLTAGTNNIRLCPPLILSRAEAELGFQVMRVRCWKWRDVEVVGG
ncbi:MAG: aminotransferase class III-fold pyridoxal phosphate-dependent enzyme [Caldilineaceae bacterium]